MSNTPEPQRLELTRATLSRWAHEWWALTRRTPAPIAALTAALLPLSYSQALPPVIDDLVGCVLLAAMLLLYARADHHTAWTNVWDTFRRGTPSYFLAIATIYITLLLAVVAVIAVVAMLIAFAGITYVICREAFMGQVRNARQEQRAASAQAAPSPGI